MAERYVLYGSRFLKSFPCLSCTIIIPPIDLVSSTERMR